MILNEEITALCVKMYNIWIWIGNYHLLATTAVKVQSVLWFSQM